MFCVRCGAATPETSRFCPQCGVSVSAAPALAVATMEVPRRATVHFVYAGFWLRFLAMIVDGIIFTPVVIIVAVLTGIAVPELGPHRLDKPAVVAFVVAGYVGLAVAAAIGTWLYYTLMESSRYQATLGKMVLGIQVTDLEGNRISLARANGRYFGKVLSKMVLYIGFIMAAFTEKKQALHDVIAGCLVVRKP